MTTTHALDERSIALRRRVIAALAGGRRGHLGSSLSLIEMLRVLYDDVLRFRPEDPRWQNRDRLVLSKGHGCLALYALLADKGFFAQEELARFCHCDALLGGHPNGCKVPGVEASTGSLGHGLAIGLGQALCARVDRRDSRVFVILGDGECGEGAVWEAAMSAGKHKLSHLTVLVDYNKHQSYGSTAAVLDLEPFADKWRSFGFAAAEVDGHDVHALREMLLRLPLDPQKPSAIICHTVKGRGIDFAENNLEWHHKSGLTDAQIASLEEALERCACAKPA